jgi:hypothetical protein
MKTNRNCRAYKSAGNMITGLRKGIRHLFLGRNLMDYV